MNSTLSAPEVWKPVVGFEGYYEISSRGRVRSVDRVIPHPRLIQQTVYGRVLKQERSNNGYLRVFLSRDGKQNLHTVHRLVLSAFAGPPGVNEEARHIDGDQANNAASNLRWGSKSQNMQDRIKHGRNPFSSKTHCPQGHPYNAGNTYRDGRGRKCRTCHRERQRAYKARKRAERNND